MLQRIQYFIFLKYCILYFYKINNVKLRLILVNMGYKRYSNNTFIVDNNTSTSGTLKKSDDKIIYFGIAKPKGSNTFRNLNQTDIDKGIQSDTDGCSAIITYTSSKSNVGLINYTLSQNTSGADRTIIFKYNNIDLFHILQKYNGDNLTYKADNIYICLIPQMSTTPDKTYLFVNIQNFRPTQTELNTYNYKTMSGTNGFNTTYSGSGLMLYFSNISLPENKTIKELKEDGTLTAVRENNSFTSRYNSQIPYHMEKVNIPSTKNGLYDFSDESKKETAFNTNYSMYVINQSGQGEVYNKEKSIRFNIFDNSYYYGIYTCTKKITYDIIIYSIDVHTVTSEIGYKQYIFNMENNVGDGFTDSSPSKYMNLQFKKELTTSNNACSYLLWEKSNTLLYDSFKPETISNLKTKYNLKSKTNANDINYFYGQYILNVTGNTICKKGKSSRYNWTSSLVNYIFELKDGETEFKKKSNITLIGAYTIEV